MGGRPPPTPHRPHRALVTPDRGPPGVRMQKAVPGASFKRLPQNSGVFVFGNHLSPTGHEGAGGHGWGEKGGAAHAQPGPRARVRGACSGCGEGRGGRARNRGLCV